MSGKRSTIETLCLIRSKKLEMRKFLSNADDEMLYDVSENDVMIKLVI